MLSERAYVAPVDAVLPEIDPVPPVPANVNAQLTFTSTGDGTEIVPSET